MAIQILKARLPDFLGGWLVHDKFLTTKMSTFRGASHSRWFHTKSSTYNPAAAESMADDHEMIDFSL